MNTISQVDLIALTEFVCNNYGNERQRSSYNQAEGVVADFAGVVHGWHADIYQS